MSNNTYERYLMILIIYSKITQPPLVSMLRAWEMWKTINNSKQITKQEARIVAKTLII